MVLNQDKPTKSAIRQRADEVKEYRCKNLIAVIEDPTDIRNIGTVIRNVNALGVEKAYVVDPRGSLPDDWEDMRHRRSLAKTSVFGSSVAGTSSTRCCFEITCARMSTRAGDTKGSNVNWPPGIPMIWRSTPTPKSQSFGRSCNKLIDGLRTPVGNPVRVTCSSDCTVPK